MTVLVRHDPPSIALRGLPLALAMSGLLWLLLAVPVVLLVRWLA